ncbi:ECF transporter S component [Ornithinibacillus sp. BX22]|uniref:Riboflavin transporter n=2 Tax=Ornithinibacillus TaxID=484508 RepID=A0A923L860_9BACI|nr:MULTISPECIES: ECF transporter S component [Ornithinibacillus]MBC5638189.1 ECF transporter S component [Ornithinibacillus hominis]MBS3682182.1 ECF transporter S component [Ornithinibacillus massiliensis]
MQKTTMQSSNLARLIILSLLGAVSLLLFFLNFPLPLLPSYLKIDFSDVPAIMASLIFSPLAGVIVVAIKNVLYLAIGGGEIVGVTANFLAGVLLVLPIGILYHKFKNVKSVVSGLITGTIIMAIGLSVFNYFILLPVYGLMMGWGEMTHSVKLGMVLVGILPFNVIKGIIIGALFVPVFIKMRRWIEQQQAKFA